MNTIEALIFLKRGLLYLFMILFLLTGCSSRSSPWVEPTQQPTQTADKIAPNVSEPAATKVIEGQDKGELTADQAAILGSLEKIDDFPLYTMRFVGDYEQIISATEQDPIEGSILSSTSSINKEFHWNCALFTALSDSQSKLFGRNFDWDYSPALLLYNYPIQGYTSVSVVDIAYLVRNEVVDQLAELPLVERKGLLKAPYLPFDGMNEMGLAVGMAAVENSRFPWDPAKETLDSVLIMRKILDQAQTLDQAVEIINSYNIDWGDGPALHYLIADRSGQAMLIEFVNGEMETISNQDPYHLATNFLRTNDPDNATNNCWRYDVIQDKLVASNGTLSTDGAMSLLEAVSWSEAARGTQWSVVYDMTRGGIHIVMGRNYDRVYTFNLVAE